MKVAVFVYDFPHYKSQQGILHLMAAGIKPVVVFAQDKLTLGIEYSNIRVIPRRVYVNETKDVAKAFGLHYIEALHDSGEVVDIIKSLYLDLGIVLGARILKKHTIEAFNIGILNMHPGLIPINRGLDNIKWAIADNLKQAVSTHLIDERVDMGSIIDTRIVDVYEDDSLSDIQMRVHEVEHMAMVEVVKAYMKGNINPLPVIDKGKYNRAMSMSEESLLMAKFKYYKYYYSKMRTG